MGNHDQMMLIERDPRLWRKRTSLWYQNGGDKTIRSYGGKWKIQNDEEKSKIFTKHRGWVKELPLVIKFPNIKVDGRVVYASHSPLDIAMQIAENTEILERALTHGSKEALHCSIAGLTTLIEAIMWRHFKSPLDVPDNKIFNVTGHNTLDEPFVNEHLACVDTGAGYGVDGKLTAILMPEKKIISQEVIEDTWEFKK